MKTKLLKRFRKWAREKIYIIRIPAGYSVRIYNPMPFVDDYNREIFDELEDAKRYCDELRRGYILHLLEREYRKRKIY